MLEYWSERPRTNSIERVTVTVTAHIRLLESQMRVNCLSRVCYKVRLTFTKLQMGISVRKVIFKASDYTKKAMLS